MVACDPPRPSRARLPDASCTSSREPGRAHLTLVEEDRVARRARGPLEVRIVRHDDVRRLATALERDALQVRLRRQYCMTGLAGRGRAGEGDAIDVHVQRERLAGCLPNPGTTLNTPAGMPASSASSASRIAVSGDFSEGLSTSELPAASTGPIFQAAMSSGKFQGTIAPTTPIGSRVISASVPGARRRDLVIDLSTASAYQRMQRALAGDVDA